MMHPPQLVTKRGIIHLFKIGILFEDREFEHDIYELIRAFYPGSEIHSFYEKEEEACDLFFKISKQVDSCVISYENAETKGVTSAEFIKGQSSDALVSCTDAENQDASVQKERAHAVRKERKDIVKIALYKLLVKLTGKTLPWGNLTGIRPAKLAMGLIESGMKNTEAAQEMRERYMVSPQKTALAITIANREREILKDIDYENGYSLYVGIPFCPSICLYCSFSSYPLKQWKDRVYLYLDALCKEIRAVAQIMHEKGKKLDTVYIGGGTPTTLEPDQLKILLDEITANFDCEHLAEFTIEAGRPDSITREKLQMIRNYPITRISVNPQTMNQETLDIIGRRHTVDETKQAFALARECGFDNINMDLILGLPGETTDDMRASVRYLAAHPVFGVKLQLLHVLEGTDLGTLYKNDPFPLFTLEEYCDLIADCLALLPPEMVIHRLTGDGPRRLLLAPQWSTDKKRVLNTIHRQLAGRDLWQGKYYRNEEFHG